MLEENREKEVERKYCPLENTSPHRLPHTLREGVTARNLAPGVSMTGIAPSSTVPMVPKRIPIPVLKQPIAILRITVLCPSPIVSGKFGAVVWGDERLIESMPVCTRRGSLRRKEVRVVPAGIRLLWVRPERVLVPRTDDVGYARWVQELFVVTEDDKEEESGETNLDEEGDDVRPSTPVPGSLTPYARREGSVRSRNVPLLEVTYILQHQPRLASCW
jgi:hypothetical protein